ncbi:hypothetical protein SUGI_0916610 [Cryptomeria japonica]|nr:hypothetical protein SUGI_0916610 [Cryptomeria japonica]
MGYTKEKGVFVFLLLCLLLTPRFALASASASASDDESHPDYEKGSTYDYHPGYCGNWSGGFHGECVLWRHHECDSVCKNVDNEDFGECHMYIWGTVCYCYRKC